MLVVCHQVHSSPLTRPEQSVWGRTLLRAALQHQGVWLPENMLQGPALALFNRIQDAHGLYASIAHCKTLIAVALADGPIGIDCEPRQGHRDWQALAETFFTAGEAGVIALAPADNKRDEFLRRWTLKEAYIKALRGNLLADLNKLHATDLRRPACDEASPDTPWRVWQGQRQGCLISLCAAVKSVTAPTNFSYMTSSNEPLQAQSPWHEWSAELCAPFRKNL